MEFFFSSRFILAEVIVLMALFGAFLWTYMYDMYMWILRIIGILTPRKLMMKKKLKEEEKSDAHTQEVSTEAPGRPTDISVLKGMEVKEITEESHKKRRYEAVLSPEQKEKILDLLAHIRTRLARWDVAESRALIIEWLSIDKHHRELNLLLASLYEKDQDFKKSELIYKDLAKSHPEDQEILQKLAKNLIMLRKFAIAYEIEKKLVRLFGEETDLYTVTSLAFELGHQGEALEYARNYLKQYPKNPDILWIKAQCLIALGERKEAIEDLLKLKHMSPYNAELAELIQKLMMEEEMAVNFGK